MYYATSIYTLVAQETARLTDIPTPGTSKGISTFFPDTPPPSLPYIEIMRIDIKKRGTVTAKELLKIAAEKAKKEGLDGLIVEEKREERWTDYEGYGHKNSCLYTMGIKFIATMDYVEQLPRLAKIYALEENKTWTHVASLNIEPSGQLASSWGRNLSDSLILQTEIIPYSEYHLLHEKKNWKEKFDEFGKVKGRTLYRLQDWELKSVSLNINPKGQLKSMFVQDSQHHKDILIRYRYDKLGKLKLRTISDNSQNPMMVETFRYDEEGKLEGLLISKGKKGEEVPYLKVEYEFYTKEDIPKWVKVIQPTQ